MKSVPRGYGTHTDFMNMVKDAAEQRAREIEQELATAFATRVREEQVSAILVAEIDVHELTDILIAHPRILKSLVVAANVAARAIERDLGIKNVNTYEPRLDERRAAAIAGYLKPFLPASVSIPTLVALDRVAFVDKEIRALKGRWEKRVTEALSRDAGLTFKKRKFRVAGEQFEIDAAFPPTGSIETAIDVKRIEARRDIHKRIDEIVNKANKVAVHNPACRFGTVIYFPFEDQHRQIRNRLSATAVHGVAFANETTPSIEGAARDVLRKLGR